MLGRAPKHPARSQKDQGLLTLQLRYKIFADPAYKKTHQRLFATKHARHYTTHDKCLRCPPRAGLASGCSRSAPATITACGTLGRAARSGIVIVRQRACYNKLWSRCDRAGCFGGAANHMVASRPGPIGARGYPLESQNLPGISVVVFPVYNLYMSKLQ